MIMATEGAAKKHTLDFTNVKENSGINPTRMPEGDYEAKVIKVLETEKDGVPMWNFIFQLSDRATATYPYYCKLQENQLWKVRNLLIAAGKIVPKRRVGVDPNNIVGAVVGITLTDDEYDGKEKSVIDAVFPRDELADGPDVSDTVETNRDEAGTEDLDEDLDLDEL